MGHPVTSGIPDLFKDGVTFIGGINSHTRFMDMSGKQSVTGMITTREFTPFFDGPGEIGPVEPPLQPRPEPGSWVVQFKMHRDFSEYRAYDGSTRGWGMFGTLAAADGRTNRATRRYSRLSTVSRSRRS